MCIRDRNSAAAAIQPTRSATCQGPAKDTAVPTTAPTPTEASSRVVADVEPPRSRRAAGDWLDSGDSRDGVLGMCRSLAPRQNQRLVAGRLLSREGTAVRPEGTAVRPEGTAVRPEGTAEGEASTTPGALRVATAGTAGRRATRR